MKPFLTILLSLLAIHLLGQKPHAAVKDTSICNFMTWLFQNDTSFKAVRYVDNNMIKWHPASITYLDSTVSSEFFNNESVFSKNGRLTQYLNKQDAAYFADQLKRQQKLTWKPALCGTTQNSIVKLVNDWSGTVAECQPLRTPSQPMSHS